MEELSSVISSRYVPFDGGQFWCGIAGEQDPSTSEPLVLVHGGPGFTSYYLEPLLPLREVVPLVFWDQSGCGRSALPSGRKRFSLDSFTDELEALRLAIGAPRMHLLGHSFGGVIIGEYAVRYPEHVASALFVSASLDIPRWLQDAARLRASLPLMTKMVLTEGDRTGNYSSPQYLAAYREYIDRFIYRFESVPEVILRSERESDPVTYKTVWGPNELVVTGVVKEYSFSSKLPTLKCPTRFMCGRFDEATPEAHSYFASLIPGAECVVFEQSAHHPQINENGRFIEEVKRFLLK